MPRTTGTTHTVTDERLRIPDAYLAHCDLCGGDLDIRADGVHQWTAGWVMQRAGGGGHAIRCVDRARRWAHRGCVDRAADGLLDQGTLAL